MSSKTKKAVEVLKNHLTNLDNITNVQQGNNWKAVVKDTFVLYLGTDSSITERLNNLYFTKLETYTIPGVIGILDEHVYDESKKENFKNLVNSAIQHINSNGLYSNRIKNNFLNSFNNIQIISGIIFIITTVFAIGNYFGNLEREREIIKFESTIVKQQRKVGAQKDMLDFLIKENKRLKDSTKNAR